MLQRSLRAVRRIVLKAVDSGDGVSSLGELLKTVTPSAPDGKPDHPTTCSTTKNAPPEVAVRPLRSPNR